MRFLLPLLALASITSAQTVVPAGGGSYLRGLPAGVKGPPQEVWITENIKGPLPTNDWSSSLLWMQYSERQYPHPLAVAAEKTGLRLYYPGGNITAGKDAIFGFMPVSKDDLVIGHSDVADFPDARLDAFSDWFVTASMMRDGRGMKISCGHGSPFVYAMYTGGSAKVSFAKPPAIWSGDAKSAVLGVSVGNRHYGLFGPTGCTWEGIGTATLICRAGAAGNTVHFSAAVLPENQPATLALFAKYAHNHITNTTVTWKYEPTTSAIVTEYRIATAAREGNSQGTLLALYPHQWRNTADKLLPLEYASVRGKMKLLEGDHFTTTMTFPGVLPALPNVGAVDPAKIRPLLDKEVAAKVPGIRDTYAEGKWLGRTATLAGIADVYGETASAAALRKRIADRLAQWLTAADVSSQPKRTGLFAYEPRWGTLIGLPPSFGSNDELNDHHFHYGYFLIAAAEAIRGDAEFASPGQFGPMLKLLVRDVASPDRADTLFPFLRNFDPYAGHSWASGHARFGDGNNNESSSEAMNAWTGLILLGQYTNDTALRDLGIYLYTTEMHAIQEYWFNVHGDNFPATYPASVVTMVWGGKGANGTWFSGKPEMVHGINFLPIQGGSLYLGLYPEYVTKNYGALLKETSGRPLEDWVDILWMYHATAEPAAAMKDLEASGGNHKSEGGNSAANTLHWIATLNVLGTPDRSVTADWPLYAVLRKGQTKKHVACNPTQQEISVRFSDGVELRVAPGKTMVD
ncbi:MAG: glycosyl hydrolase [Tepidisphaeraceae bacterium]|jgi:endoglucanase Acf2